MSSLAAAGVGLLASCGHSERASEMRFVYRRRRALSEQGRIAVISSRSSSSSSGRRIRSLSSVEYGIQERSCATRELGLLYTWNKKDHRDSVELP